MAVVLAESAVSGGADVGEDEAGGGLAGNAFEVGAVPGRDGRAEEAGGLAEFGVGVEADAEAVGVVLATSGVLQEVLE